MQKVIVYSESRYHSEQIRMRLEAKLPYHVESAFNQVALEQALANKCFNLMIYQTKELTDEGYDFLKNLNGEGHVFPIILISEKAKLPQVYNVFDMPHLHAIQEPMQEKTLLGLARKLVVSKTIPQQQFQRFRTNQLAEVEAIMDGDYLVGNMYNLSKGGAYCEFDGPRVFSIGDLVRVKVSLNDMKSERLVNAKVVWTTIKGRTSGRPGVGMRFVNAQETYKSLMDKL